MNGTELTGKSSAKRYPATPDGRYFVVRGRLWRAADPALPADEKAARTHALMEARRAVKAALSSADPDALAAARAGSIRRKERSVSGAPSGGRMAHPI